jgi:uncharacterized protein YaiE (UPF0345 family)
VKRRLFERQKRPTAHSAAATPAKFLGLRAGRGNRYIHGMANIPQQFSNVTVVAKANVYFDGKVVSHSVLFADGSKKTIGLIYPGKFHFGTDKAERMELTAGQWRVRLDGQAQWRDYAAGQMFEVPAKSGFDIEVATGLCEYICSFLG